MEVVFVFMVHIRVIEAGETVMRLPRPEGVVLNR